jgi:hypothetical protein
MEDTHVCLDTLREIHDLYELSEEGRIILN